MHKNNIESQNSFDNKCFGTIHVVKQGDTLYNISRTYGVKVSSVMLANPYVNVYNLQVGDEICVPRLSFDVESMPGQSGEEMAGNRNGTIPNAENSGIGRTTENNMNNQRAGETGRAPMRGNGAMTGTMPMTGNKTVMEPMPMTGNRNVAGSMPMTGNRTVTEPTPTTGNRTMTEPAPMSGNRTVAETMPMTGNRSMAEPMPMTGNRTVTEAAPMTENRAMTQTAEDTANIALRERVPMSTRFALEEMPIDINYEAQGVSPRYQICDDTGECTINNANEIYENVMNMTNYEWFNYNCNSTNCSGMDCNIETEEQVAQPTDTFNTDKFLNRYHNQKFRNQRASRDNFEAMYDGIRDNPQAQSKKVTFSSRQSIHEVLTETGMTMDDFNAYMGQLAGEL